MLDLFFRKYAWTANLVLLFAAAWLSAKTVNTLVGAVITELTPNVQISIEAGSIARTALGALLVGGLAALLPLRRVAKVDPATAFRRP